MISTEGWCRTKLSERLSAECVTVRVGMGSRSGKACESGDAIFNVWYPGQ